MKTPADFDRWFDDMWLKERRYPDWGELVRAVQQDAIDAIKRELCEYGGHMGAVISVESAVGVVESFRPTEAA